MNQYPPDPLLREVKALALVGRYAEIVYLMRQNGTFEWLRGFLMGVAVTLAVASLIQVHNIAP